MHPNTTSDHKTQKNTQIKMTKGTSQNNKKNFQSKKKEISFERSYWSQRKYAAPKVILF